MPDFDLSEYLKEAGGVFRFGSGVLGKSAIALVVLFCAVVVACWRLHSDAAILISLGIGGVLFLGWLFGVLYFAGKHPDIALLEGAEWSGFQRFQATKALSQIPSGETPTIPPGADPNSLTVIDPKVPDEAKPL